MREYVTSANLITSGNLTAGFLALVAAQANRLFLAAGLVAVAGVLDSLDGPLARRNGSDGAFGTNLDSLADLVSFGVAPMLALYLGLLHRLPVLGLVACLGFLLCGAWRLARFPLIKSSHRFVGLPIPPTGVVVAVLAAWGPPLIPTLAITALLSGLMVSPLPFPTLSAAAAEVVSLPRRLAHGRSPTDTQRAGERRPRRVRDRRPG